jgi:hypothetical protein
MKRLLLAVCVCVLLPSLAYATPYVSPEEGMEMGDRPQRQVLRSIVPGAMDYEYDPLNRLGKCAAFIEVHQVSDTSAMAYGGMREGEHMQNVIQTDNTSESIWIWSRHYALTGDTTYLDNIDAAWIYCMNFRAYDEEGGSDPVTGYYRVYNCAWALRAHMEYSAVFGDFTYSSYADSCASYLCHHPLDLHYPVGMYRRLNGLVMGWAIGNLYDYGQYSGNPVFTARSLDLADSLKIWAEYNPNKFHWKEWAMEGGAVMWGIVNSRFADDPTGLETWVDTYAPYLNTEIDSSQYQNAWRGWAALGQHTASQALDSDVYGANFKHLADTLVQNDGDDDGGIPVIDAEPDDHDQTWVTNYLGFMCMVPLMDTAGSPPADVAAGTGLRATAFPNPSSGLPGLRLALSGGAPVSVRVYDVKGRMVGREDLGTLPEGRHTLSLDLKAPLSPGVYFYSVSTGREVARGKLVVLR